MPLARFLYGDSSRGVRAPCFTCENKKAGPFPDLPDIHGGDGGTRTPDPYVANVMLYQLSYIPMGTYLVRRLFCLSLVHLSNQNLKEVKEVILKRQDSHKWFRALRVASKGFL